MLIMCLTKLSLSTCIFCPASLLWCEAFHNISACSYPTVTMENFGTTLASASIELCRVKIIHIAFEPYHDETT